MASRFTHPAALVLAFGLLQPSEVWAQTADEKETARSLMERGDKALESNDAEGAVRAFEAADEIMKVPSTGLARGKALVKVGRLVEAADVLTRVSRTPATDGEDPVLAKARAEATRITSEIAARIPSVTIELSGLASGVVAEVAIDGKVLPPSLIGLPAKVDPGKHRVTAKAPRYLTVERELSLAEGESAKLPLKLAPDPNAKDEPTVPSTTPTGSGPGQTPPAKSQDSTDSGGVPAWAWVVGSIGIASLAGSGAGLGLQLSAASTLDEECGADRQSCKEPYDFESDRSTEQIGNGLFIGLGVTGIVAVGIAIIGIATAPSGGAPAAAWQLVPFGGAEGGGVALRSRLD